MARTRNFADVIRAKIAANPDLAKAVGAASFNADVATKVYELRTEAKLTQKQLAERIGTHQSVISRIEDADYDGHSLTLLTRIAEALGKKLRVEFYSCQAPPVGSVTKTFAVNWSPGGGWQPAIHEERTPPVAAMSEAAASDPLVGHGLLARRLGLTRPAAKEAGSPV